MAPWDTYAEALRAAAAGTLLSSPLSRTIVAPGPDFARDCRMVGVYLERPETVPAVTGFAGGVCYSAVQLTFQVVFVADCVPAVRDDGSPPAPADITAWSRAFLADSALIYGSLVDAIEALGVCDNASLGDGVPTGPTGATATMRFPVTILDVT